MFNSPAHHAQIVVKPFIGRATRPREPGARRWLVVEAGRIGLDAQERDEIAIFPDAKLACGLVCTPQPLRERWIFGELWIVLYEILAHTLHEAFGINVGERRNLFSSQLKHTDVLWSARH